MIDEQKAAAIKRLEVAKEALDDFLGQYLLDDDAWKAAANAQPHIAWALDLIDKSNK